MKKEPLRMCIVCREMKEKKDLLRIVQQKDGSVFRDETMKAAGRGAYVCNCSDCMVKLKKNKALNKSFKCMIEEGVYDSICGGTFETKT